MSLYEKMDPVLTLKRSCEVDAKACIFCQKRLKDEYLRTATDHCKTVVRDAMNMRNKFRDVPGVPKKTIHCLISRNVKSIKAISLK